MTDLQKEFEASGYTSWINSDLYPDGKIYTQEYTQWLEKRVESMLTLIREMVELKDLSDKIKKAVKIAEDYKRQGYGMQLADEVHAEAIADYTKRKEIAQEEMVKSMQIAEITREIRAILKQLNQDEGIAGI
jgi:hypothetical protein